MKFMAAVIGWALVWYVAICYGMLIGALFEKLHKRLSTPGIIIGMTAGAIVFALAFEDKYPGMDGAPWVEQYATALKFEFLTWEGLLILASAVVAAYVAKRL